MLVAGAIFDELQEEVEPRRLCLTSSLKFTRFYYFIKSGLSSSC